MPTTDFKETVKQQADIVRIVDGYVKLKKAGAQNFSGLCPFHNEKTPSFSVHATRQFFHCFGCGVSGDVFAFIMRVENITFPESVRLVAQKLGIALPKVEFSSPQEAREAKLRMVLLDIHERAATFLQDYLKRPEGAAARSYLAGRGLDDRPAPGDRRRHRARNRLSDSDRRGRLSGAPGRGRPRGLRTGDTPSAPTLARDLQPARTRLGGGRGFGSRTAAHPCDASRRARARRGHDRRADRGGGRGRRRLQRPGARSFLRMPGKRRW